MYFPYLRQLFVIGMFNATANKNGETFFEHYVITGFFFASIACFKSTLLVACQYHSRI